MVATLAVLRQALVRAVPAPADDEIIRRLKEILSRPEFIPQRNPVADWIRSFFLWLGTLHDTAPVLYWLLLAGCIILLALLLAHIGYTVYRVFAVSRRYGREETAESRRRRLSADYLAEAQRCAEQQDYTEAIRYLFLSLVYRFDESGRVGLRQDLTNREYLMLFHDREPVQSRLKVFVDTLDENWYGQHPTARIQYEECWVLYRTLERGGVLTPA